MVEVHQRSRRAKKGPPPLEQLLVLVLDQMRELYWARMQQVELSPPQALTLRFLDEPRAMRALADMHRCDASNMTGIADRLEERGLVERRPDPNDRRVKLLALTDAGRQVRADLSRDIAEEIPGLKRLTRTQRTALEALLWRVFGPEPEIG